MAIKVGDLIQWQSKRWLVYKVDPDTATAFVESQDNERQILGTEADCPVLCNPPNDWPGVTIPPRKGRLLRIQRAALTGPVSLSWLFDWAKMDEFQMGGTLYLNPELYLEYGDRLILCQRNNAGTQLSFPVEIPRDFQPFSQKKKARDQIAMEKRATADLYDHVRNDDD
jgi:hypothetical protein